MAKKTIAVYGDTPTVSTGFGNVIKSIFTNCVDDYDVKIMGINYAGYPHDLPMKIYPAMNPLMPGYIPGDYYGREHLAKWVEMEKFDAFFILNDAWLLRDFMPQIIEIVRQKSKDIPIIVYFPVDTDETEAVWYDWLKEVNVAVTYTQFAYDTIKSLVPDLTLSVIPHGANVEIFKPIPRGSNETAAHYRTIVGDKFAFLNVNKNQVRKNIPGCIGAMREYLRLTKNDEDTLVLHMAETEPIGCHIRIVANALNFPGKASIRVSPAKLNEEQLNCMYNACNAVITSACGEGWGLSISEAICAGVPVIAPRHTSFPEVVRDFGLLYDPGQLFTALPLNTDRSNRRYYIDPKVLAAAMVKVHDNYPHYRELALAGRKWYSENRTWKDHVVPQWKELFKQVLS